MNLPKNSASHTGVKLALKNLAEQENIKIKEILTVDQQSISAQIWMRWRLDHKKIKDFWKI